TAFKKEYLSSFQIEEGSESTSYESYGLTIPDLIHENSKNEKPLFNKEIVGFGDSIMRGKGNGMLEMIGENNSMIYRNYGSDGATIAPREGYDNQIIKKVNEAINDSLTPDYIVFNGLTNDANVTDAERIGEISDGYDLPEEVNTFSGAFEELIYKIRN